VALAMVGILILPLQLATAQDGPNFTPGKWGIGDPYYPLQGNGGYDARHYALQIRYNPATDRLAGRARISAVATKNLSRFNLDFIGLRVESVAVDGAEATWRRPNKRELVIKPSLGLEDGESFVVVVRYAGRPEAMCVEAFGDLRRPPHRRRRAHTRAAGERAGVVPGQRPPRGQGDLHDPARGSPGGRGNLERTSPRDFYGPGMDDLDLGWRRTHGELPHRRRDRPVRDQ
jgi:hypothetical protein